VNDTNDLPKGATTIHSRKKGLHQRQEQRKHQVQQVKLQPLEASQLRWVVEEQPQHLLLPLPLLA
jgi:hypothetical protein